MDSNYNYSKSSSISNRYSTKGNRPGSLIKRINKKTFERVINQFIVSLAIALVIIVVSNFNGTFIDTVVGGVRWVTGADYDFAAAAGGIIPGIDDRIKDIPGIVGDLLGNEAVDAMSDNTVPVMIIPADGKIILNYGTNTGTESSDTGEYHSGIDIAGDEGMPVKSALDGIVAGIGQDDVLGRMVKIKHDDGFETVYAHCSEILVNENQTVKQGEYIAKIGRTGLANEPYLHFEVLKDGVHIDPLSVVGCIAEAR